MASPYKSRPKSQEQYSCGENVYEDEIDSSGGNAEEFHVMRMEPRPFRPFKTSEEYLYAMKEDLAEWLNTLYNQNITVDDFFEKLEIGVLLCQHANSVTKLAQDFKLTRKLDIRIPDRDVVYKTDVQPGTFKARDNISNFITWCRAINIKECLLFETDDLVMRKNERSFILCLLEVARCGARYGMPAPVLVQMEQEIDAEIEDSDGEGVDNEYAREAVMTRSYQTQEQRMAQLMGLHERVVNLLNGCTCPSQFPMIKVADGKYRIGDTKVLIFVRILRNHVMVRVGGGWDTLEHYLDKHDPCRCRAGHRFSTSAKLNMSVGKGGTPSMQVTYKRPTTQNDSPTYRNPSNNVSNFAMEHAVETGEDGFRNGSMDYAINAGRKSHDFSSHNYNTYYQFSSARKPRSKSFDNASNYLTQEENRHGSPNLASKRFPAPKAMRKENSDPSTGVDQSYGSPDRNCSFRKSPLLPSCPNKIPLQKSTSKSKIPCLEHPLQKSPKSQSTEDLFRTKYYLGADDRWMRSRSSSSSPVHGTPRSTSMEQCNLSAISANHKSPSRRNSQHEESSQFLRARPGQYSFRMTKKSPELRRKNDSVNKTWSFHNKGQRPPLHSEWTGSPGRGKQSPLVSQHTPQPASKIGRISSKTSVNRPSNISPQSLELDTDDKNSTELLRNIKQLIDQCESKYGQDQENDTYENDNGTNQNGVAINRGEASPSPENGTCKSNVTSNSQKNRLSRESPTGSASRIPVPQWK